MRSNKLVRLTRLAPAGLVLLVTACGQNPESTERARGIFTGPNLVVALTIAFVVVSGLVLVAAIGIDRFVRTRRQLETAAPEPEEAEEEEEEVVAGIGVGRAGVPKWLYGFYVLIPLFAFLYVVNNVALVPAAEEPAAEETPAPTGPQTEWTLVASGIVFDLDRLILPPETDVVVTFENRDAGVPHNFYIWPDEAAAQAADDAAAVYAGSLFNGVATRVEEFTSPAAGEYYFNCTVHPTSMFGTVEVVAG